MKKFYFILVLFVLFILTSCNVNTQIIGIDIVYKDESFEQINYNGLKSSCALYNIKTKEAYSATIIENKNNDYYIISSSYLGNINDKVSLFTEEYNIDGGNIIGLDSKNGLSLIKINTTLELECVTIANSVTKGETIYTVSTPLGIKNNESSINQINRGIVSRISSYYINIDSSLNETSYGCGIYNKDGNLLGIMIDKVYSDLNTSYYVQGMSYAICNEYLIKSYQDMKEYGEITRPQLGITVLEYHKSVIDMYTSLYPGEGYEKLHVPDDDRTYIIIKEIEEGSNAYNILNKGDVIISINNEDVYHTTDISSIINFSNINDTINLTISRYDEQSETFIEYNYNICLILNDQS